MTNAQNNVKYGKFTVEELFDVKGTKSTDAGKVHFVGKQDGDAQFIGRTNVNYGLQGYVNSDDFAFEPNKANTISVSQVGTITAQYRDFPYYTSQNITKLSADFLNRQIGLYICSAINQWLRGAQFEGYHTLKMADLKKQQLVLPVTSSGTPDFEYMEERIRELEEERIRELEAYLKVTGLSDAILTDEEQAALDKMNMGGVKWKKFKIDTILDKPIAGNVDIQRKDISNNGEFVVTSGLTNYGIQGHTTKFANIVKDPSLTIDMFGNVFYRDEPYKLVTHGRVYGFTSKLIKSRETGLFLATVLHPLHEKFSYNNMFTWNKIKNLEIALPVTSSGDIDFDFIENYITAIEKQSIRGVIEYKDKVIQTTKDVVNAN